uniref:Uncharacterized protein n=1 Tax=Solanum lycopersicum TaxID=4081 RepID=A0A3Q7IFH0_SOLLC
MSTNVWTDAGNVVNQVYDILNVMGMTMLLFLWEVKGAYFLMVPFCMTLVDILV